MIAEAQAAQSVVGFVITVAAWSGVFILGHLIWREVKGRSQLPKHPRPFRAADETGMVLVAMGVFVAQQFAMFLVVSQRFRGTHWGLVGILLALNFGVIAYMFAVRRIMRPRGRVRARIGQGLLVVWAALPVIYGFHVVIQALGGAGERQQSITYMVEGGAGWEYLAVFSVLVAPLLEEIAFRGLLYPAIRSWRGPTAAIIVTSVLFGLVHMGPSVITPLAVFGVFLGYLVENTGSILPCVIAHAAFNGLTVAQIIVAK